MAQIADREQRQAQRIANEAAVVGRAGAGFT
jgi:hypothetical protein